MNARASYTVSGFRNYGTAASPVIGGCEVRRTVQASSPGEAIDLVEEIVGPMVGKSVTPATLGRPPHMPRPEMVEIRVRDLAAALSVRHMDLFLPLGSIGPQSWPGGPYEGRTKGPDVRSWTHSPVPADEWPILATTATRVQ
jgi:hypothetical protein